MCYWDERKLVSDALVTEADALLRNEGIPHALLDFGLLRKPLDGRLTGAAGSRPRRRRAQWPAEYGPGSRSAQNARVRAAQASYAGGPHAFFVLRPVLPG